MRINIVDRSRKLLLLTMLLTSTAVTFAGGENCAYSWRGYMLDCSRHFFTVTEIKKTLDAMHAFGLNVFHWHLTDGDGWRLPISRYPALTQEGAIKRVKKVRRSTTAMEDVDGEYGPFSYAKEEVRDIVRYAAERGIRVIPEIDIPGHSAAAIRAYPELKCLVAGSASELCIGKDEVLRFYENVLLEVMALFPDEVVHLGGDECSYRHWRHCPDCQRRIREEGLRDERDLLAWFTIRFAKFLEQHGRRMMGWDDVLDAEDLPRSVIVMTYRSSKNLGVEAARRGHDVVETPDAFCYFDYVQGLLNDPYEYQPFGCCVTWRKIAGFDPAAGYPSELRHKVLGAQGNMWTELVCDLKGVEWRTWPRLAALAEVLRNGPATDIERFAVKMSEAEGRLRMMNVNVAPTGPFFPEVPILEPGVKCLWNRPDFAKLLPCPIDPAKMCFDLDDKRDEVQKIYARHDSSLRAGQYVVDLDWMRIEVSASDASGFTNACRQLRKLARRKKDGVMEFQAGRIATGGAELRHLSLAELGAKHKAYTNASGKIFRYLWAEPRHMQLGANYPLRLLAPDAQVKPVALLNRWRKDNFEAFLIVPEDMAIDELISNVCRTVRPLNRHDIRWCRTLIDGPGTEGDGRMEMSPCRAMDCEQKNRSHCPEVQCM